METTEHPEVQAAKEQFKAAMRTGHIAFEEMLEMMAEDAERVATKELSISHDSEHTYIAKAFKKKAKKLQRWARKIAKK